MEDALCREMHMIQHQAGANIRVERCKFDVLMHETVCSRGSCLRCKSAARLLADKNSEIDRLNTELMQAHGTLAGKNSTITFLHTCPTELRASVPELESRQRLKLKLAALAERQRSQKKQLVVLCRELAEARKEVETLRVTRTDVESRSTSDFIMVAVTPITVYLRDKTVLCVGGGSGNVADYRGIVEQGGARFIHHDGGLEDNVGQIYANLAAADLVIC